MSNTSRTSYCFFSSTWTIFDESLINIISSFFLLLLEDSDITQSAYLKVFKVLSKEVFAGEMLEIIRASHLPKKQSFKTYVSLDPLKGMCLLPWSIALMHSFKAKRDLLISAPSF
jgi:hypothetical protein